MYFFLKYIILILLCYINLVCVSIVDAQQCTVVLSKDTGIIRALEVKTKSIHNSDPELGIKLVDSLCSYYKQYNKTNEFYVAQLNLGDCYNVMQKNYQVLSIYETCSKYFNKVNDSLHLFNVYTGIGNINFAMRNLQKAATYYRLAIQYCN